MTHRSRVVSRGKTVRPAAALAGLAACMLFAMTAAGSPTAGEPPSLILHNGKVVTVGETFAIAQAVAIGGDRILAVGDDAEILQRRQPETRLVDLEGRTVIPGLIDNHVHFIRATEHWTREARLEGVTSRRRALEIVAEKAASLPAGAWVLTLGGWHEDQFTDDGQGFTRRELDRIAPDNPAFIQSKYEHAFVNTAWLDAMGFPVEADPAYRDRAEGLAADVVRTETGVATGRLEGGFAMVRRAIERFPEVSEREQRVRIQAAMRDFNALGLTAVYDPGGMGLSPESYTRLAAVVDEGEASLRVFYTLWGGIDIESPAEIDTLIAKIRSNTPFQGSPWLDRVALGEVYYPAFHFDNFTRTVSPDAAVRANAREILRAAAEGGWSVQTHAVRPATIDGLLDASEAVHRIQPVRPLRWTITHADKIGAPQIERARALGMHLQLRSQRVIGGLAAIFEGHGDAVYRMPPLRLVADSGIRYGLGSDGTKAAQINPFISLWWAVTGKMLNGEVITRQTLTREEALIAHTRANAFMVFQEANLGAIAPGLLADMVILDRDYLTVPADEIRDIRPVATLVGGSFVYGRGFPSE